MWSVKMDKMLTQQLRELEKDGLIRRTVYPVVPPKTEYSMTDFGRTLAPIIEAMQQWGQTHLNIAGCEERGATGTRYKWTESQTKHAYFLKSRMLFWHEFFYFFHTVGISGFLESGDSFFKIDSRILCFFWRFQDFPKTAVSTADGDKIVRLFSKI